MTHTPIPFVIHRTDTGVELWNKQQAAEHCGLQTRSFHIYARGGRAPKPVLYIGTQAYWDSDEIKHWNAHRTRRPRNQ